MRRLPALIAILVTTLSIAACGGSGSQQSGQAAPPQETQAEKQATPATQSAPTEKNTPEESAASESAQEESARGNGEAARLSVTTLEGEEVAVGGQGDVTALYFMAGW